MDNNEGFNYKQLQQKLHPKEEPKPEEPKIINGTNRKGFFVREKRRPGKKGVNRNANSLSDGEASSDEESSDEQERNNNNEKEEEQVFCILTVPKGQRADIWKKGCRGCNCRGCRGWGDKNLTAKNRKLLKLEALTFL